MYFSWFLSNNFFVYLIKLVLMCFIFDYNVYDCRENRGGLIFIVENG